MNNWVKAVVPIAVAIFLWLLPVPQGLTPNAWAYFAVFIGVVVALVLQPLPGAAVGLIGVAAAAMLKLVPQANGSPATTASSLQWLLSGFSDSTVWLIFCAFMFAMGYEKTGLGRRIALALMKKMGGTTLGIAYAVSFADLALAPFTPSNTARSGGTVYPIAINIPPMYQSFPEEGRRKMGAYLMWNCLAVCAVTSSMFVTSSTPPILAIAMVHKAAPDLAVITWMDWCIAVAPACILLFLVTPILSYLIFPPSVKSSPEAPKWAASELQKLGPITRREITMTVIAFAALGMWVGGSKYMNATMVGIVAVCLLIILDVVKWEDVLKNQNAWNTLAWFATLISMASGLGRVGFVKWFADYSASYFSGSSVTIVMIGMVAVFYFAHYFFASLVAHLVAMLPVMLATALVVPGMNIRIFGMLLIGIIGMMSMLTPYAGGPSGIYYNSRYITPKEFWILGFIFGVIYFTVYTGISMIWMPMVM